MAEDSGGHLDVRPHHQGSLPFVSHAPSTIQCSSDLLPIWRSGEARDIGGFGVGDDRKEGCRTSVANKFAGVLQPAFPGTEEGRLLETRHRPVRSQQSPHNPLLLYGDVRADHECRPSGRVADLVGPDRCVLSRTHLPDTQEVSSLCGEGSGLSVHRSPVRTVDGSICLLEAGQVCGGICSYSQSFSPPIPRRLAPQSTHPFYVKGDNSVAPVVADCSGFQSQFQKIRHEPRAAEDIPRNSVRFCQIPGSALPGPHPALPRGVANVFNETSAAGIVLAEIDRPPSISHEDCSFRSHDAQADSKKPEFPMEPGVYDSISQGSGLRRGLISSAVVVGGTEPPTGDVPPPISAPSADVYRCFNSGVGCLSELTIRSGHLGCERIEAHQYSGNDCGAAGLPVLHRSHPGPRPPGIVRQHHCGGVHQPPGRYSVQPHIPCCRVSSLFPVQPQGESEVSSHSRDPKHGSRPAVEGDIPVLDRMVSSPRDSTDGLGQIPSSPGGPVRNPSQQQARCVCIPLPAPSGMGGRCSKHIVGGFGCLCLPSHKTTSSCLSEDTKTQLPYPSNSPQVAEAGLVCGNPEPAVCAALGAPLPSETAKTARVRCFPPEPMVSEASRLAVISQANVKEGFSLNACSLMADSLKESAIKQYESRWKLFVSLCKANNVSYLTPTIPQNLLLGMSLRPFQHQVQMFTDASTQGWGACLNSLSVEGTWGVSESRHINILEMTAVLRACQSFIAHIRDRDLLVLSDNTTVVAYINHQGGTRSNPTSRVAEFLHFFLFNHKVRVRSRHIAGILNTVADQLSRGTSQSLTEWSLHPEIAQMVWDRYHRPLVDLFATHLNNKLDVFVSPFQHHLAWEVDALNISWEGLDAYAFPPTKLPALVLAKIQRHNCRILLIAPRWPKQAWFAEILNLLYAQPWELPYHQKLLKLPGSDVFHQNLWFLRLHVWPLYHKLT